MEFAQLVLAQLRQTYVIGIWICRIISYYIIFIMFCFCVKSHVSLGLFQGWLEIIKLELSRRSLTVWVNWWTKELLLHLLQLRPAVDCHNQAIASTYHEEQRIFLLSTLNHNPHQVISKLHSFPEDLRGVGHSRIWVPMICLEQIGTSRACNVSQ